MLNLIDLTKRIDIPQYEEFETFYNNTLQDAPKVSSIMCVTYQVRNIELEAKQLIGIYRLPVQKQTLGGFMESNGFPLTAKGVLTSLDKCKGVRYRGRDDDEMAIRSYKMIQRKNQESIFLGTMPRGTNLDDLTEVEVKLGYILFQTGKGMVEVKSYKASPKEVAEADIRKVLRSVLRDKRQNKNAHTFEDAIECLSRVDKKTVTSIKDEMTRTYAGHKIWNALTAKELYEILREDKSLVGHSKVSLEEINVLKKTK